jgi:ACS family allantoate permease-like MFS transporter
MTLLLIIRYVLSTENKRRDQEQLDNSYDDIYIERMGKDGQVERVKVDKVNYLCSRCDANNWLIL